MNKPRIFISSTIYDFADLRSSLKYWLTEAGFDVQMSEHSDFDKNSSVNSYDACLETIATCDHFILLVGARKGGMFDDDVSITRKEYQTAYELAKEGKIKKIINFVRQNVWDALEDRKNSDSLHSSKVLEDPEHIMSFVTEIKRIEDMKSGKKPLFNWVNTFSSFSDIVNTLSNELKLKINISELVALQTIELAIVGNLKEIFKKDDEEIYPFYKDFEPLHNMLVNNSLNNSKACKDKIHLATDFFLYQKSRIDKLNTFAFDDSISNGIFLEYDSSSNEIRPTNFHRALLDMSNAIKRLRLISPNPVFQGGQKEFIDNGSEVKVNYGQTPLKIIYDLKAFYSYTAIYECLVDIVELSKFIFKYIKTHNEDCEYPTLFRQKISESKPGEDEILQLLQEVIPQGTNKS